MSRRAISDPRLRIKDAQREAARFRVRAIAGFILIALSLIGLGVRFAYLQIARHDEFSTRSDNNRISVRSIAPTRGLIYDRNGVLLADNVAAFRLEVVPEQVKNMTAILADLGGVVALSDDDIERFDALRRSKHAFESIPLRFKLSEDEIARFSTQRWRFPGVDIVPYLTRAYPHGEEFAHLVGYVGRIDVADAEKVDADRYAGTTHIGKTGIERSHEDELHGEPGYEQVEVNVDKRPLRTINRVAPTPGENLYLSIDARVQRVAEDAFEGRAGAAVAIDPRNGEVLALVSVPSFDPNLFVNGIGKVDYSTLLNAPDKPLLNRAIAGGYTPGSTVKPFLGLGGLELGLRKPSDTVLSTGEFFIPGQARAYRDDVRGGQGRVDLVQAIAQSVNTYFYSLALDMGIDRFSNWMGKFGFGQATGIDLPGEGAGVLPSRAWKRGRFNQAFYPGETVIAGIGQGYWVVTPIQLAQALATLADRGVRHPPHLLRAAQDGLNAPQQLLPQPAASASIIHNAANWIPVEQGMTAVVNGGGTAKGLGDGFPYVIAGKTGTAERYSRTDEAWQNIMSVAVERHEVLFEAFAPADAARIAVVVALQAGHTGAHDAAPIARKILDAWLKYDDDAGGGAMNPDIALRLRRWLVRALREPYLDFPLLGALSLLAICGLVTLYSASDLDQHLALNQALRFALGAALMLTIARIPPSTLRNWTPWLYATSLLLLIAVAVLGQGRGANRWLNLGVMRFQPSELVKLTLPMMIAWYLQARELPPRWTALAAVTVLIGVPALLIARQPDLGTALLVVASGVFVVFLAGLAWWRIVALLGAVAAAAPLVWHFMHEYQRNRLRMFLDPESDPLGNGWHIIQSEIAVGSGGWFGKGWHHGTQSRLEFLPEHTTDFVFAVFSEEWGLIGVIALLVLYIFIVGRGLSIAANARDTYSRLLAGSISMAFFVYVMVNGGMITGLLPVVGVPLPLISYGGTSAVSLLAGFGVLMSIHGHRKLLPR